MNHQTNKMDAFTVGLATKVIQWRWLVVAISLIFIALVASNARFLEFTTDYRVFFGKDNEQLAAYEELQKTYEKSDNVLFVLAPKDGQVFTKKTLTAIEYLTKEAWQTPYSTRVDSLSNYQHTEAEEDDLIVADLFEEAGLLSTEAIEKIKNTALNEPLLVHRLVSEKGHVTAVNVTVQLPGKALAENDEVVKFSRDLANQFRTQFPNIDVHITGFVFLNNAFQESSQQDMATLIPIMFGIVIIALMIMLRSVSSTLATVVLIFTSIAVAMGAAGLLGIRLTPPSSSAPTIILTMAVADAVHMLVTFLQGMRQGKSKEAAMIESYRVNFQPIFLTSLTTIIGFSSMNFSEVPPFHDLGNIVSFGVAAAFLLSITLLPALVMILPVRVKVREENQVNHFDKFALFVIGNRRQILWSMVVLALLSISFLPKNELNDEWVQYFDKSVEFRQATDFTVENLTGLYTLEYSIKAKEESGIARPKVLATIENFANWANQQDEVVHVNTITDIMKRLNKNLHADDTSYYRLPEDREAAAQYLLLYEMSLPYGLDLNNQLNIDKSATRVILTLRNLSTKETINFENRIAQWMKSNASDLEFAGASPTLMFAHIGARNIQSMLGGTAVALVLISAILVFALKSKKMGLISLVPNLVPAAMAFGLWGLFVAQVGMSLAMVAGMTIGIVVDDTVHFLSKYLRAKRENNLDVEGAIRYAFSQVGAALWVTSLVLVAGFSVLNFSTFSMNADMGVLTAITIAIALIVDFLLLPALLLTTEGEKNVKTSIAFKPVDAA